MDVEQLNEDVDEERVDGDRLIELLGAAQGQLQRAKQQLESTQRQLDEANEHIAELE